MQMHEKSVIPMLVTVHRKLQNPRRRCRATPGTQRYARAEATFRPHRGAAAKPLRSLLLKYEISRCVLTPRQAEELAKLGIGKTLVPP